MMRRDLTIPGFRRSPAVASSSAGESEPGGRAGPPEYPPGSEPSTSSARPFDADRAAEILQQARAE
jgi:hypothetical protein